MANTKTSRLALSDWQAQTLRLTIFPASGSIVSPHEKWWEQLVGEPPVDVLSQPRLGSYQAGGPFENGKLVLVVEPLKMDWVYTTLDNESDDAVSVGRLDTGLDVLRDIANRWFKNASVPSVARIAFGAVLISPIDSRETGYALLSSYLRFEVDANDTSDFLYQINRRRDALTNIVGLRINRLTKWSLMTLFRTRMALNPESSRLISEEKRGAFARIELDINTSPDFQGELNLLQQITVFDELIDLGIEIVQQGDIP